MSYYDPKIYNDDALTPEERKMIGVYDLAIHDAGNKDFIIDGMLGYEDKLNASTLEQIKREIAEEPIASVVAYMQTKRLETIVAWIDSRADEEDDA